MCNWLNSFYYNQVFVYLLCTWEFVFMVIENGEKKKIFHIPHAGDFVRQLVYIFLQIRRSHSKIWMFGSIAWCNWSKILNCLVHSDWAPKKKSIKIPIITKIILFMGAKFLGWHVMIFIDVHKQFSCGLNSLNVHCKMHSYLITDKS